MSGDHSPHHASSKKSHKRKRDLDASVPTTSTPTPTKKSKKTESPAATPVQNAEKRKKKRRSDVSIGDKAQEETPRKESAAASSSGKATTPKSDDADGSRKKKSKKSKRKSSGDDAEVPEDAADLDETATDSKASTKEEALPTAEDDSSKPAKGKFSSILSKFERTRQVKEAAAVQEGDVTDRQAAGELTAEPVVAQGLEPLPQPEVVPEPEAKPTYSSLPPWLANPLRTRTDERTKFSELGIEDDLLKILEGNGYKEAFAVQSAVIPLLLKGRRNHPGDLCISAATGSGKTLSYVLPLVTALGPSPAPRMRGLIVVPTRELVKQAREACELCAAGSGLRVASAVGNVAIKDEQRSLMRVEQVYGPETFKQRQDTKLTDQDWTNFNLQDYVSEVGDRGECLPGYTPRAEPNVDILICTPGRLVDHIRYTKGFTLKHLEWLVIDEADRLLNESFQEWVDVVMNSLDARKSDDAFGSSGKVLAELGLPIQTKEPRKVILSATMTRDVTKLNSLRLSNPKLVLIGSAESTGEDNADEMEVDRLDDHFTLPSTLKEYSISVGDGSQKPLHLLRLLLSHIKVGGSEGTKKPEVSDDDTSSSDETSSDESDSDSDSDSETSSSDDTSSDDSDSDSSDDESTSSDESSSDDSMSEDEAPAKTGVKHASSRPTVLIFTKSSESASRLSRLLALLDPSLADQIGTIIKSNKSSASRKTLTAFRHGKISIIIATDRASRGLDLPSLNHVVNYDVPTSVTTYVHRVGRTARAEKEGSAWTLVAHREGRWFTNEIAGTANGKITRSSKVSRVVVSLSEMKDKKARYSRALEMLEKEVQTGGTVKSSKVKQ